MLWRYFFEWPVSKFWEAGPDRGCVKTQNNFAERKIDLSERALCDFLDVANGVPIHEFLPDLRFDTASTQTSRSTHLA
jgi:hypothetical protein